MRKSFIALIVASAALAGAAQASDTGYYVGAAGTQAHVGTSALSDNNSTGVKLFGGYNLSSRYAIEGAVDQTSGYRDGSDKVKVQEASVSLVAKAPLSRNLSAFGKVGVAYQDVKEAGDTMTAVNPVIGVGVTYAVNNNWSIRAEEEFSNKVADASVSQSRFSVGVQRSF